MTVTIKMSKFIMTAAVAACSEAVAECSAAATVSMISFEFHSNHKKFKNCKQQQQ